MINLLIVTENGRDLTKTYKKQICKPYLEKDNVYIITDPLFVFPNFLLKKVLELNEDDVVVAVPESGEGYYTFHADDARKRLSGYDGKSYDALVKKEDTNA